MVYRIYVEKKEGLQNEAVALASEIKTFLGINSVEKVRILNRYDAENITEAGLVIETLNKSLHLVSLSANKINDLLNKKLTQNITDDDITSTLALIDAVAKKITEVPNLVKALGVAYENLRTEEETKLARGGQEIYSSMNADEN